MSLKDLPKLTFATDRGAMPEGMKISPGDYGHHTPVELHRIYTVAKERVKLHSPVFGTLIFEWEVSPQFMALMLHLSARVRSRDDETSISDNELRERMREAAEYGEYPYGVGRIGGHTYRAPPPNPVTISTKEPVRIPGGLEKDEDALVVFLVHHARERLRWFVYHEVDEMLLLDNERKFDPHPPPYTFKARQRYDHGSRTGRPLRVRSLRPADERNRERVPALR